MHGGALAIVLPRSTGEVVEIVRIAAAENLPIVPQGATPACFGSVPHAGERRIVVSLSRKSRIREMDREGSVVVADAGTVLASLHEAAGVVGRQFPLHLSAEGTAQIGGLVSSNAGGTAGLDRRGYATRVRSPLSATPDWVVLIHLGSPDPDSDPRERLEAYLGERLADGTVPDAVVARSSEQAQQFWELRHSVTEANLKAGVGTTLDVSVRVSAAPEFLRAGSEALSREYPDALTVVESRFGDGRRGRGNPAQVHAGSCDDRPGACLAGTVFLAGALWSQAEEALEWVTAEKRAREAQLQAMAIDEAVVEAARNRRKDAVPRFPSGGRS